MNRTQKAYLQLHIAVLFFGFTAILGNDKLISIPAISIVWWRVLFTSISLFFFINFGKSLRKIPKQFLWQYIVIGAIVALHWITFFEAINQSNVSITLAMFSTGAFFASILEPILYKRKVIWYELLFGLIVVVGLGIIFKVETKSATGIYLAITSAFLSALFSVINGKYAKEYNPNIISLYELSSGVFFLSIYLFFAGSFTPAFFTLSSNDFIWLFLLSSICTAYAFIGSVHVMKYLTPYSVVLTYNLEPIYGIVLALVLFPESETMQPLFYLGACLIICTVLLNALFKNIKKPKI